MLYFMQGFDIQQYIPELVGANTGGKDDSYNDLWGGVPVWPPYVDGFEGGRAVVINTNFGTGVNWSPGLSPRAQKFTIGSWIRLGTSRGGPYVNLYDCSFLDADGNWRYILLRLHFDQTTHLYLDGVDVETGPTIGSLNYQYVELEVNLPENYIRFRVNGVGPQHPLAWPDIPATSGLQLNIGGPWVVFQNRAFDLHYDHLWVADEPFEFTTGIGGVSVLSLSDRFESTNHFRGGLIIDGKRYQSKYRDSALVTSFGTDENLANTQTFIFPVNPQTGESWTPSSFANVEAWGVCHEIQSSVTRFQKSRLLAMSMAWLDINLGRPIIRYQIPGRTAYLSGPWVKTNPKRTYVSHINTVPRPAIALKSEANYLTIDDDGCLFIPNDPEAIRPSDIIGLTFAEERRNDYNEWLDILGEALPFTSSFVTGYNVLAEGNKSFQSNYVTVNYVPLPFGSAYIQGLWDYAQTGDTGRWSSKQQIYSNSDVRYSNRMRKLKIRGHGNALQMRVTSEANKPFSINGWTMAASSNTSV